jgi:hypothetical protein
MLASTRLEDRFVVAEIVGEIFFAIKRPFRTFEIPLEWPRGG